MMVLTVLSACIDLPGANDDAMTHLHYVDNYSMNICRIMMIINMSKTNL